jgi:hypothetical protein
MKKLFSAFAVLALVAAGAVQAQEKKGEAHPKAAACCGAKCDMKDGKCTAHEAKKCAKDCAAACCKPAKKGDHPKGEHPKGEHPKG